MIAIKPFLPVSPTIYCYATPEVLNNQGWVKIGYTEKQSAQERIAQQTHTAGVRALLKWQERAQYKDGSGEWFKDHDFHRYLSEVRKVLRRPKTEWFQVDDKTARGYFNDFADRRSDYDLGEQLDYSLRQEQQEAVAKTKAYFESEGEEFLWNAKPRFGKTLSSYDLIRRMGFTKVLVVTNRPSIANSWLEDFNKFMGWRKELCFVSELDALKGKAGAYTRESYLAAARRIGRETGKQPGFVEFESLQNLKGSVYFGGLFDKLQWLTALEFDLLIVDEAHEGVDTMRTDEAFEQIRRKHALYLSGTPFKALADGDFREEQIFNWTYADEQRAKAEWSGEASNPYERLPRMALFTYQLSNMIRERVGQGMTLPGGESADYAFDLNEFFETNESGEFVHREDVKKFLRALATQEKYPFSTPELRAELAHTLWLLNRVASAKALAKMLQEDEVFGEYEIVLAAGDGRLDEDDSNKKAFDRVKEALAKHEKTITLSVGQLTVGVTIPEWSGVLMLCNLQSPAAYMQAAFRAQNPCAFTRAGADDKPQFVRKETAYVFDFDPARTLLIFDEFANNLSPSTAAGRGSSEERQRKILELLNFFPVLGEDDEGRMEELDAARVLSIPRRIKSLEVVRRGFMSNFLFQNIGNVFGAPAAVREIIEKLSPAKEELGRSRQNGLENIGRVNVDEEGRVDVPGQLVLNRSGEIFGPKIYQELGEKLKPLQPNLDENQDAGTDQGDGADAFAQNFKDFMDKAGDLVANTLVEPAAKTYKASKSVKNRVIRQVKEQVEARLQGVQREFQRQKNVALAELKQREREALSEEELAAAQETCKKQVAAAQATLNQGISERVQEIIQNKPKEVVELFERNKAEAEKKTVEDSVRDHLRGFSRAIPSFIMAYGDANLTLANFDDYTEDDVFLEVTGISEADFRFLRDGGDYKDPETGEARHFAGQLFDETVFNDSIQEFLKKKAELANYFDESHEEDIFDYIPPQKTNQIYTPRWVVKKMVDALEAENPGCFDNPKSTFADLYMKSGLYITEIVKRLYHSQGLKAAFPDEGARIRHILREQVYGMAPTRIIYLIATNYILGFSEKLKAETKNFVEADAAEAAKKGELERLVAHHFGGRRGVLFG